MTHASSFEVAPLLHLVLQPLRSAKSTTKRATAQGTNHIAVIDISGSMTGDLPRLRQHLKNRLSALLKPNDTFTLIWFSGRKEFGVVVEGETVAGAKDLSNVHHAIDRWLRPVGLTGFKEPLEEVARVVERVKTRNKNPFSLMFMSDGCDNQWDRLSILKAVTKAADGLAASAFVEYGYYADRQLLAAMAERTGGVHIFAEDFPRYEPLVEELLKRPASGGKRVEVKIKGDPIGGFAFTLGEDASLVTFEVQGDTLNVPEGTKEIWYLSSTCIGVAGSTLDDLARGEFDAVDGDAEPTSYAVCGAYAALSLFAVRMKPEMVYPLLKAIGDVRFIDSFATCFGKQRYSEFMEAAKAAAFDASKRFVQGRDPSRVPADDAFTVLDALRILSEDDGVRILLDHPRFVYNRISRGRLNADDHLSADEQEQLDDIRARMEGEKSAAKLEALQAELDALLASKREALKFVADPAPDGYPLMGLTYNEHRPNVSILVKKIGTVDLSSRLAATPIANVPSVFNTHVWRNYAIVKDGLVNVEELPVKLSPATVQKLRNAGCSMSVVFDGRHDVYILQLKHVPILNRKIVKEAASAKAFIELEYDLTAARAAQKVYNGFVKELFPPATSEGLVSKYGIDAAQWLREQGLTDNGFAPKTVQAESKDFYIGKTLDVSLKGLASLPSLNDVRARLREGKKPSGGGALMTETVKLVEQFLGKNPTKVHHDWLTGKAKTQTAATRGLLYQKAKIVFGILVGQTWFREFAGLDENKLTVQVGGVEVQGTITMAEEEIRI